MTPPRQELLPGTLEMLILQVLCEVELHGYGIAQRILQTSNEVLKVEEGSLYPALQRLLAKNLVKAEWANTATNRRARFYKLTPAGRKQLGIQVQDFDRMITAITRIIRPSEG